MNALKTTWTNLDPKRRTIIKRTMGAIIGAVAGYTYYALVGCSTGSCAITSDPWISTGWGALLGLTASA